MIDRNTVPPLTEKQDRQPVVVRVKSPMEQRKAASKKADVDASSPIARPTINKAALLPYVLRTGGRQTLLGTEPFSARAADLIAERINSYSDYELELEFEDGRLFGIDGFFKKVLSEPDRDLKPEARISDAELISILEENSDIIPANKGEAAALRKLDIEKRLTDTESYIAAAANFVPPKMSKTAVEGVRVLLELAKAGDVGPIVELIARAGGEATLPLGEPSGSKKVKKKNRPYRYEAGIRPLAPPSRKHVADMTPEEKAKKNEADKRYQAARRARLG